MKLVFGTLVMWTISFMIGFTASSCMKSAAPEAAAAAPLAATEKSAHELRLDRDTERCVQACGPGRMRRMRWSGMTGMPECECGDSDVTVNTEIEVDQ